MGLSENRVYSQWNSHLIGIMISKTIGFRDTRHFQTHPDINRWIFRGFNGSRCRLPPAGLMATSRRCRLQAGGLRRELMIMKHVCCHIETKHIAGTWGLMLRNVLTLMLKVEVSWNGGAPKPSIIDTYGFGDLPFYAVERCLASKIWVLIFASRVNSTAVTSSWPAAIWW